MDAAGIRKTLGENVARIRRIRGMTVREFSAQLKQLGLTLSPSGISEVETASRKVSVDELLVFAIALNTSVIDLLTPSDGSPLAISETVEPLPPRALEEWLQGDTAWPPRGDRGSNTAAEQLDEYFATASDVRQRMHRQDRRPEVQAAHLLKHRVRLAIEALEDPKNANGSDEVLIRLMKHYLQLTDDSVQSLSKQIEEIARRDPDAFGTGRSDGG